jgi:hypothetical protein
MACNWLDEVNWTLSVFAASVDDWGLVPGARATLFSPLGVTMVLLIEVSIFTIFPLCFSRCTVDVCHSGIERKNFSET